MPILKPFRVACPAISAAVIRHVQTASVAPSAITRVVRRLTLNLGCNNLSAASASLQLGERQRWRLEFEPAMPAESLWGALTRLQAARLYSWTSPPRRSRCTTRSFVGARHGASFRADRWAQGSKWQHPVRRHYLQRKTFTDMTWEASGCCWISDHDEAASSSYLRAQVNGPPVGVRPLAVNRDGEAACLTEHLLRDSPTKASWMRGGASRRELRGKMCGNVSSVERKRQPVFSRASSCG